MILLFRNFRLILAATIALLAVSCAGLRDDAPGAGDGAGDSGMMDAPCNECGERGDIKLKIKDEKFYREWNVAAFARLDSNATIGVFPTLKVNAIRPENCRMCHSFSADALDFDLARIEDSLMVLAFPKMNRELMLPGMRVPDEDSLYMDTLAVKILKSRFADGLPLSAFKPWMDRSGIEQPFVRDVPNELKNILNGVASRYGLRYASIPLVLEVTMDPKLGRSGGFSWKIIWSIWDLRYGELVLLTYSEYVAESTSRVAPEKEWAAPFAERLWKMLNVDINALEAH